MHAEKKALHSPRRGSQDRFTEITAASTSRKPSPATTGFRNGANGNGRRKEVLNEGDLSPPLRAEGQTTTSAASPDRTSSPSRGRRRRRARRQTLPVAEGGTLIEAAAVGIGGPAPSPHLRPTHPHGHAVAALQTASISRSRSLPLGMAAHAAPPEQSALLLAAKTGQTALLTRLLAQGEDVNVRSFGSNPLHWVPYLKATCVVCVLLGRADPAIMVGCRRRTKGTRVVWRPCSRPTASISTPRSPNTGPHSP